MASFAEVRAYTFTPRVFEVPGQGALPGQPTWPTSPGAQLGTVGREWWLGHVLGRVWWRDMSSRPKPPPLQLLTSEYTTSSAEYTTSGAPAVAVVAM